MRKIMKALQKIALIGSIIVLTGCGFHLRGDTPIPPETSTLYLKTSKPYNTLSKNLRETLTSAGVNLVSFSKDAPVTLQIVSETSGQSIANIGTNTTTRQYNLTYVAVYQLTNAAGKIIAGPFTVTENTALMTTSNEMLSSSTTQAQLQEQMQQQAAQQILNVLIAPDTVQTIRASMGH